MTTTAVELATGPAASVWRSVAFRRIWFAQVVSEVGDWAARLAMSILVFTATGSALQSALVFSVSLLPALGPGQWLTVRTGKLPRRTLFLVTESTRAALLALLALFPGTALAMVVAFATGLVRVPFMSQRSALIPEIVGLDHVVSATKITQVTQNLTILLGYAMGGVLVGLFTTSGALLFGGATFAVSGLLLASIGHPANRTRASEDSAPSLRAGWTALRTLPAVTAAATLSTIALGAGVAIESQAVPLASTLPILTLGGTTVPTSTVASALLMGSTLVAAAAAVAVPSRWRERALLTWSAALIIGPAMAGVIGFGIGGPWASTVALIACGAMFGAAGPANAVAAMQLPVDKRAAVFALVIGALFAAQAVAGPIAGYLFDQYGTDGLAAMLVVPVLAAAVAHLTLTRTWTGPAPTQPAEPDPDGAVAPVGAARGRCEHFDGSALPPAAWPEREIVGGGSTGPAVC
ncbi:MAG: MFS transporter [Candidatus Nanopelagicales bacterium]